MKKVNLNSLDSNCYLTTDENLSDRLIENSSTKSSSNSARASLSGYNSKHYTNFKNLFASNSISSENSSYLSEESEDEGIKEELESIRTRKQRTVDDTLQSIERENLQDMIEAIETTFRKLNDRATNIEETARYVSEKQSRVNSEITENLSFISEMRAHVKMLLEKQSRIGRNYPDIQRYVEDASMEIHEYTRVETPPFKPKRQDLYNEKEFSDDDEYYSNHKNAKGKNKNSYTKDEDNNDYYTKHVDEEDYESEQIRLNPLKTDNILPNDEDADYRYINGESGLKQENQEADECVNDNENGVVNGITEERENIISSEPIQKETEQDVNNNYYPTNDDDKALVDGDTTNTNGHVSDEDAINGELASLERKEETVKRRESLERQISEELTEEERLIVERLKMRLLEEDHYEEERKNGHKEESVYIDDEARAKAMAALQELEEGA